MNAGIAIALAFVACGPTRTAEPAAAPPSPPSPPSHPSPPWPAAAEPPAPARFHWETVHHQTIHVRVLVPDGRTAERSKDGNGYPTIEIPVGDDRVTCTFDSGVGALAATVAKHPPTVYGMPVEALQVDSDHLAVRYRDSDHVLRISGFAPGATCTFEAYAPLSDAARDDIFTVCASVRAAAPGPWRAATDDERAHGGMTDVPDGAWVEPDLPATPGSLLRPGRFIAAMHVGELVIRSEPCPSSFDEGREVEAPEVDVQLEHRHRDRGDVWIRRSTEEYNGDRYPGATIMLEPRGARCCVAELVPWTSAPSAAKIDYAIALCDTFRES